MTCEVLGRAVAATPQCGRSKSQKSVSEVSQPQEINMLIGQDRNAILTKGACLGGQKVSVIKDNYIDDGTIDARTKNSCGGPTFAVSISRTKSALIMVVGKEGVHGGTVNTAVSPTVEYLTKSGY
uniref:Profilin n=1 Tax=Geotrypetes seraphini TaxID=260995 RepID=A0A6P8PZ48_GEOSA|nr:profilin-1 isoform X2 [Geotrypetes seraphini]